MEQYLFPFFLSFLLSAALLALVVFLSRRIRISRRNGSDRGCRPVSRFGGIALTFAFLVSVFLNPDLEMTRQLSGLLIGVMLILLVGTWDDISPLPWWIQLLFQGGIAALIFSFGLRAWVITKPFGEPIFLHPEEWILPSLLVGLLWTILVMNAVNFSDGVDGLLGGISLVAFTALFLVSLRPEVNQPAVAILSAILAGTALSFLVFNFPPARIFAGTSGSFFFGFSIAALSLFAGAKVATALLVLAVPVLDALFVIRERIRSGVSPFRGDRRHLHYRLLELGWSERAIAISYILASALAGTAALLFEPGEKVFFLLSVAAGFLFLASQIGRKLKTRT